MSNLQWVKMSNYNGLLLVAMIDIKVSFTYRWTGENEKKTVVSSQVRHCLFSSTVQVTLKRHGFQLHGSTLYMDFFPINICNTVNVFSFLIFFL